MWKAIVAGLVVGTLCGVAAAGRPPEVVMLLHPFLPWKRSPGSGGQLTPSRGWGRKDDRGFGGGLDAWRVPPMRMTQRSETKGLFWAND